MSAEEETIQERRITFCLYESWEKIAGSSGLPALKNLQRHEIEAFKSNLVLLDLRNGKDTATFQVIGNGLAEDLENDLVGRPLSEVPRRSMLSRVTDHYLEVLANRVPIAFEAEFVNRDGEKALYRGILLPFSDDNQNINFILGGVRWILAKDVKLDEDKPTIEELMRTIADGRDELTLEDETVTTSGEENNDLDNPEESILNEEQPDEMLETTNLEQEEVALEEDLQPEKSQIDIADLNEDEHQFASSDVMDESDANQEEVLSEEKVIFEEPPQKNQEMDDINSAEQDAEEISAQEEAVEIEDPLSEDDYIEIDETTSFEADVIEELTASPEISVEEQSDQEEEISASHQGPEVAIEEELIETKNEAEVDLSSQDEVSVIPETIDKTVAEEKPAKKERKGSVIERSMEMLLGKSKKKDIFGHEIKSEDSKITLPKQPELSNEELEAENEIESEDVGAASLVEELDVQEDSEKIEQDDFSETLDVEVENIKIDISEDIIDPSPEAINKIEAEDVTVSFEDEINKVIENPIEEANDVAQLDETITEVISETGADIETEELSFDPIDEPVKEEIHIEVHSDTVQEDITVEDNAEITIDMPLADTPDDQSITLEEESSSSDMDIIPSVQDDIPVEEAIVQDEQNDEESLYELQGSLKQIIQYIKKEDASHNRSRDSLYNILTVIYKFHDVCEKSPKAYNELVAENDLKIQERAPFTPVLKICLGKDYDKTRLTEYAAALGIAKHMNIAVEDFHDFIKHFPGGIKGCVKEMRAIRKGSNGANLVQQTRTVEEARNILKDMPVIGRIRLKKMIISKDADEFCLLLAKRRGHDIDVLKVLDDQYTKIDPILKRAAFIKGNLKKEK